MYCHGDLTGIATVYCYRDIVAFLQFSSVLIWELAVSYSLFSSVFLLRLFISFSSVLLWGRTISCSLFSIVLLWGCTISCSLFSIVLLWGCTISCSLFSIVLLWGCTISCSLFSSVLLWGHIISCSLFSGVLLQSPTFVRWRLICRPSLFFQPIHLHFLRNSLAVYKIMDIMSTEFMPARLQQQTHCLTKECHNTPGSSAWHNDTTHLSFLKTVSIKVGSQKSQILPRYLVA